MQAINQETMKYITAKVLTTDTIVLHYDKLDTALKAYNFFKNEFYAKSRKDVEEQEDVLFKSFKLWSDFKNGRISLVEYPEHSQYCVFVSINSPYCGYTLLNSRLLEENKITPIRISKPLKHFWYSDYGSNILEVEKLPDVKFPRNFILEQIITLDNKETKCL